MLRHSIDVEIAVARGDLAEVERLLDVSAPEGLADVEGLIARQNALLALERRDEIEAEAPSLVIPRSYIEPFALRALGWARNAEEMILEAVARFEAMGLTWHADQTKRSSGRT